MSDMKEKLSAFIDGELSDTEMQEVLLALKGDAELRQAWSRYHLVRSAIQGHSATRPGDDFAQRIAHQLAAEPAVLAPSAMSADKGFLARATGMAGRLAIAASVAAIAIIGLRTLIPDTPTGSNATVAQSVDAAKFTRVGVTRWDKGKADAEHELNMYLAEHNRYSPASNMKGMMTYVHVVGYDAEK